MKYLITNKSNNFDKFILLSLLFHIILVSVLSIHWYTNIRQSTQAIDVILVNEKNNDNLIDKNIPKKADYLAQRNQLGGGQEQTKNNPSIDMAAKFPSHKLQQVTPDLKNKLDIQNQLINIAKQTNTIATKNTDKPENNIDQNFNNSQQNEQTHFEFIQVNESNPTLDSLIHEIEQRAKLYAKRPKTRFISAATHEYRDAEYLDKWRKKIEYYGNKYYPKQAKSRNLSGNVLMLVAIRADGSVNKIKIEQSSGIKILDDAAMQAVHLAAPFEKFTTEMRKDTDVIEIVRTWSFNQDGELGLKVAGADKQTEE